MDLHCQEFSQRYLVYLMSGLLFGLLTYLAVVLMAMVGHFSLYKAYIPFRNFYASETALNFGLWIYFFEEWLARLPGVWDRWHVRRVGHVWLLWALAFIVAYAVQDTLIYARIDNYAPPVIDFFDRYPLQRPEPIVRFAVFFLIWFIVVNARILGGIWLQKILLRKRIEWIENYSKDGLTEVLPASAAVDDPPASNGVTDFQPLVFPSGKSSIAIQPQSLFYVNSEGHYCRFHVWENDRLKEIFTKVSLKTVLSILPSADFVQIHRSYVVNRKLVCRMKKAHRTYQLFVDRIETPLPVSRHRWPEVRRRLEPYCRSE